MEARLRKCASCRERAVSRAVLDRYSTTLDHDGQSYQVSVSDLPVSLCSKCGEFATGEEAEGKLSEALRIAAGLLSPAEIRQRRKGLGLTQAQLAGFLRLSPWSISRWESGAQLQQRSMDVLLRGFFESQEFRKLRGFPEPSQDWGSVKVVATHGAYLTGEAPTVWEQGGALPGFWIETKRVSLAPAPLSSTAAKKFRSVSMSLAHPQRSPRLAS